VDPPAGDGEEEIYSVLQGEATLHVGGQEYVLSPGVFVAEGAIVRDDDE